MTRRRWGLLVLSATLAFWSLGGEWVSIHQHVPENHFLDLLGGLSYIFAGIVALDRRPGNAIGTLMIAYGFIWYLGWLLVEEPDFGMWLGDFDPDWAAHPGAWHEAFPGGSPSQGRALLRQIHHLGLVGIGADAELDVVQPGTVLAEFYRLSMVATAETAISTGVMTAVEAAGITARLNEPDFLGCGVAFIGAGGNDPAAVA